MKTSIRLLVLFFFLMIGIFTKAQNMKSHLRDFKPNYIIDTFSVEGKANHLKGLVINIHKVKGIKFAFWDEDSKIMTVEYAGSQIRLSSIKAFFTERLLGSDAGRTAEK